MSMKFSPIRVSAIIFVITAVLVAGCASSRPAAPVPTPLATQATTPVVTAAPSNESVATTNETAAPSGTSSAPEAGSVVSGSDIFGTNVSYTWIEYKSVAAGITTITKIEKSGKCTIGTAGKNIRSFIIDCPPKDQMSGQQAQLNPADITSAMKFTVVGIEPVTVGAGTYPAAVKYMAASGGTTLYYWTAPGVPAFVKLMTPTSKGDMVIELNSWG
jgi:hypothetical protein